MQQTYDSNYTAATLATNHPGEDLLFILWNDFSKNNTTDRLIVSLPNRSVNIQHPFVHYILDWKEDQYFLKELSLEKQSTYYTSVIVRVWARLSFHLRKNFLANKNFSPIYNGSSPRKKSWKNTSLDKNVKFKTEYFDINTIAKLPHKFENQISQLQEKHLTDLKNAVTAKNIDFFFISLPVYEQAKNDYHSIHLQNSNYWKDTKLIGSINKSLFQDMGLDERMFLYDYNHLNFYAASSFTKILNNTLGKELYDK